MGASILAVFKPVLNMGGFSLGLASHISPLTAAAHISNIRFRCMAHKKKKKVIKFHTVDQHEPFNLIRLHTHTRLGYIIPYCVYQKKQVKFAI